ncbi:MAG: murein biosynthesis integral membrane protein MurJ [Candidatus Sericytochromatia bacterium]
MSSVLRAASLIAILALVSKVVGLLREVVINYYYGTYYIRDAYIYASQYPASFALIMLAGLNGPFHSSIVSVISKYKAQNKIKDIKTVVTTVTILSTILMSIITLLFIKFAPQIIDYSTSSTFDKKTRDLAIEQLVIMAPMFIFSGLIGISYGILNVEKSYFTPSLSPIMASLAIMVALMFATPENSAYALAWGTMIGAIFQLILQVIPMLPKIKDYFGFSINFKHEGVKDVFMILLPATLSSTVGQINIIITSYFASSMVEGSASAIYNSNLIYQLPLGVMLTALLVPMLPILSESYIKNDNKESFIKNINKGIRSLVFLSIPLSVILMLSGELFITVLFQRGKFDEYSRLITYYCLIPTAIGMVSYAIRDLLVRVFYAMNDAKTPFYITILSIFTITFFCWIFVNIFNFQADGICLAVSFVTTINMLILGTTLHKKIGPWVEKETIQQFVKISIATIPVVLFSFIFNYFINYHYNWITFGIYSILMGMVGLGCIGSLRTLKDQETIEITDKILQRFLRKKNK